MNTHIDVQRRKRQKKKNKRFQNTTQIEDLTRVVISYEIY